MSALNSTSTFPSTITKLLGSLSPPPFSASNEPFVSLPNSIFFTRPTAAVVTTGLLSYLVLVRILRNYWLNRTLREYRHSRKSRGASPMDPMTEQEAHLFHIRFHQYDFPFMALTCLEFGFFKTYGIPTISSLLAQTTELTCPMKSPKRYSDTSILVNEWILFGPGHPRYYLALSRMNYLHSRYGSKISNGDLLYTLAVFMLEPVKWVEKYEWRKPHELEKEAFYIFWKGIGERMGILGIPKPDKERGISGWDMVDKWVEEYEEKYMVFSESNKLAGDETAKLFLYYYPEFLKYPESESGKPGILRQLVTTLIPERLAAAMGIKYKPKPWVYKLSASILAFRQHLIRHFYLPRFKPWRRVETVESSQYDIQYQSWNSFKVEPWHIRPSLTNTYLSPWNWYAYVLKRVFGREDVPFIGEKDEKGRYKYGADGYYIDNVGPNRWDGKGRDAIRENAKRMQLESEGNIPKSERVVVGCPFGGFGRIRPAGPVDADKE